MPVSVAHRLIAADADWTLARHVVDHLPDRHAWLFFVGEGLAGAEARDELIVAAIRQMANDDLQVICVDGAEAPLGFRDIAIDIDSRNLDSLTIGRDFSAIVDLYSEAAACAPPPASAITWLADSGEPSYRASTSRLPLLIAVGGVLLVGLSLFLFLWAKAPSPKPAPTVDGGMASLSGGNTLGFVHGILLTLVGGALVWAVARWRNLKRGAAVPSPAPMHEERDERLCVVPPAHDGIFISYSHRDSRLAHDLADEIERQGRRPWIFERQMHGGATGWAAQVVRALRDSKAVMLVGSQEAFASDQVMREMYLAMDMRKPIVPLIIDDVEMPDDFQYILAKFQRHRMRPPIELLVSRALAEC